MLEKKIEYLNITIQTLKDEELLGNTVLRQWEIIVELIKLTQNLNLDKATILKNTEENMGNVSPENFRKRMSMLNQQFEDNNLGIEINNSKNSVVIAIDEEKFNESRNKQTAEFIKQSNDHNKLDGDKLVTPKASSKPTQSKRQVLFSYSWEPNDEELNAQRDFANMLENALKNPPAKYKDSPRVSLFTDYKDFELGEDQLEQQDAMCQETPMVVICYTHKYFYSAPCKREIDYYLTIDGQNLPDRRALVVPFDCTYNDMDARFQKNLALSPPANFTNGLDFFTSASAANKKEFIGQLVGNIYNWFDKNPNPPRFDKHYDVKNTLRDTGNRVDLSFQSPEYLKGNTQQHQYEGAINIVDLMYSWSTGTSNLETRLFYLLGDFGSGKSTSCQMLTKRLMDNYNDEIAKKDIHDNRPVLPIYLDLKKLLNAFSNQKDIAIQPINSLLETMLSSTGVVNKVSGDSIIRFINEYPCLLIFDGFDEVGQKLNAQQQTGLLNKLLEIFPKSVYQQDLNRLNEEGDNQTSSVVPINSRILISCRTHFFKNYAEQDAFHQLYYRHEAGVSSGEIKNYQIYYLLPFTKEQIENYLINWLGKTDADKALTFINNVHDLSGLSERPLMLNLIRDLLPELQKEFILNPHINASTLYKLLFDKVGYRDNEKHLIPLDEKRKLLGRFALYLWHQGITTLHVDDLDSWLLDNRHDYPQLSIKLNSGQYEPEVILQDLHNASLLVRDNDDEYRFAHTSFLEFFVAVGIFDKIIHYNNTSEGFNYIFTQNSLSKEIIQFLLDWRLSSRENERQKFDKQWQLLQKATGSNSSRQVAFDIWYFGYRENQNFTSLDKPNWQGLSLKYLKLDKQLEGNILDLSGINLSNARIENSNFSHINLSKTDLTNTYFRQNKFDSCNVRDWTDKTTCFNNNRFNDCLTPELWSSTGLPSSNLAIPSHTNSYLHDTVALQQLVYETVSGTLTNFHPDGIRMILGGEGCIDLWKMTDEGAICLHQFTDEYYVNASQFSPDGTQLVLAGHGGASLWEITSDNVKLLHKFADEYVIESCQFSPDGTQLVLADSSSASLWEITSDDVKLLHKFADENTRNRDTSSDSSFHFSSDGTQLAIASHGNASLWEITSDNVSLFYRFSAEYIIESCQFSPDGTQLVLAGSGNASLWEITSDDVKLLHKFADEYIVESCQFSPDGTQLVVASHGNASLWEIKDEGVICLHKFALSLFIRNCQFSPDGSKMITMSHGGASLWEITSDDVKFLDEFSKENLVNSCHFSSDGLRVLLGSYRGASLWEIKDEDVICLHQFAEKRAIESCQFSPDGTQLVVADSSSASLWEIIDNNIRFLHQFTANFFIKSCQFSPDGTQLVVAGYGATNLWEIKDDNVKLLHKFAEKRAIESCQFSPDGTQLVLAGHGGASLWEITSDNVKLLHQFADEYIIESCQFSPDGTQLVLAGHGNAGLWEITSDNVKLLHQFSDMLFINSSQFSPDGTQLVIVGHGGASLWKVKDEDIICLYQSADPRMMKSCQFSPDGTQLVVAGYGATNLWEIKDDNVKLLHKFAEKRAIESCQFSPDGTQLVLAGHGGASLWEITSDNVKLLHKFAKNIKVFNIAQNAVNGLIVITSFDRIYIYSLKNTEIIEVATLQSFNDSYIHYKDSSFTRIHSIKGKAWKYLYNKVTYKNGKIQILSPDTHPDWCKAYT